MRLFEISAVSFAESVRNIYFLGALTSHEEMLCTDCLGSESGRRGGELAIKFFVIPNNKSIDSTSLEYL